MIHQLVVYRLDTMLLFFSFKVNLRSFSPAPKNRTTPYSINGCASAQLTEMTSPRSNSKFRKRRQPFERCCCDKWVAEEIKKPFFYFTFLRK